MSRDDSINTAFFLIGGGGYYYYKSFVKHKLRRRMSDIPRSKIGTAAVGSNVEVQGQVINMAEDGVVSPLSSVKGAAFIWQLEHLVSNGKNSSWKHLYTFYSTPYLYIHDGEEHTAAIDLSACEFQENLFNEAVQFNNRDYNIPEKVKNILNKTSMLDTSVNASLLSQRKYRLKEKVFEYGQSIYVLGAAIPCPNQETPMNRTDKFLFGSRESSFRKKIAEAFKRGKSDSYTLSKYDTDRNLVLDKSEEAALMKDVEKQILAAHGKESINEYVKKAKLLFTIDESASGPFKLDKVYLSTKSESDLNSHLRITGLLGLIGGPIMIAVGVFLLITKFS